MMCEKKYLNSILGFYVPSIILTDLLGNTCLLVIDAFRSTLFISVFKGSLHVIALFRAIIEQFSSKIFLIFIILVSCKNKAMSASCSRRKIPLIIAISFADDDGVISDEKFVLLYDKIWLSALLLESEFSSLH